MRPLSWGEGGSRDEYICIIVDTVKSWEIHHVTYITLIPIAALDTAVDSRGGGQLLLSWPATIKCCLAVPCALYAPPAVLQRCTLPLATGATNSLRATIMQRIELREVYESSKRPVALTPSQYRQSTCTCTYSRSACVEWGHVMHCRVLSRTVLSG